MGLLGGMLPPVVATLLADIGQYELKMDAAAAKIRVVDDAGKESSGKLVNNFALAGAGILLESLHLATDFQTQMTRLYTAAGAPRDAVKAATGQVLAMGDAVGYSGTQMAEALYHPVSAGLDLATSLNAVKYSAEEAQISGATLDDTTYSLSSVMKAFNQDATQAHDTMALLNSIVGQGDMRFQDFNVSVKNWAPTSAQMGISIQSMGAALAYLTDRGNSAEEASTRVTMGLTMMAYPSQKAATMLEGLGVASSDVAASNEYMTSVMHKTGITQNQLAEDLKKPDGIYVALTHLKTALHNAGVEGTEADSVMSKVFGGGRSDKAILSLMQNLDGLKTKFDDIGTGAGKFDQAWSDTQATLGFKLKQLGAQFENIAITIGNVLIPAVSAVTGFLTQHKTVVEGLAIAVGVVLVGAMVRYVQVITGKAIGAVAEFTARLTEAGRAARSTEEGAAAAAASTSAWASKLGNAIPVIGAVAVGAVMLGQKLGQMAGVGDHTGQSITDLTKQLLDMNSGLPGTTQNMQGLAVQLALIGKTQHEVSSSNPVAVQGMKDLDASVTQLVAGGHIDQASAAFGQMQDALVKAGFSLGYIHDQLFPQYYKALTDASNASRENAGATGSTVQPMNDAADAAGNLADSLSAADQAFSLLSNHISASGMLHSFQKDLLSVKDAVGQNGKAFDETSLKGLANMEAFRQAADEVVKYRDESIKNGQVLPDQANKTAAGQIAALEQTWEKLGVNKKQVDAYATSLGLIPKDLTTTVSVKQQGMADLLKQLDVLNTKREQLGQALVVSGTRVQAHAAGGLVTGPGGPTSDSIPARLSNREFVVQASAVDKFGLPFMNAINAGRMPAFAPSSAGGGTASGAGSAGPVVVEVYLDGQKVSGVMRKQTLRYDYRNSGNNLSLASAGAGGGFR